MPPEQPRRSSRSGQEAAVRRLPPGQESSSEEEGEEESSSEEEGEEEEVYEVEDILDRREAVDGSYEYLIRWRGYSPDWDSWEPPENLEGSNELRRKFDAMADARGVARRAKQRVAKAKAKEGRALVTFSRISTPPNDDEAGNSGGARSAKRARGEEQPRDRRALKRAATGTAAALGTCSLGPDDGEESVAQLRKRVEWSIEAQRKVEQEVVASVDYQGKRGETVNRARFLVTLTNGERALLTVEECKQTCPNALLEFLISKTNIKE